MFNRIADVQKMDKFGKMENYRKELEVTHNKREQERAYNTTQEKQYELVQALNKKKEQEIINQQTMATKKSMQSLLASDYEQAIRLKQQRDKDERNQSLNTGKVTNNKAAQELEYLQKAEQEKKNMIKQILNNEKQAHDSRKQTNSMSNDMSHQEARHMFEENERRMRDREAQFGQRYNNFNDFQSKLNQSYHQQVRQPELDKQYKMNQMIKKGEQEIKQRAEIADVQKENAHKNWRLSNRAMLEKQILDKRSGKKAGETELKVDYQQRLNHESNVKDAEFLEKFQKKKQQDSYKNMLDNQMKISKQKRMYGNMTGVEKSFNKNDLSAYKHYDGNTYALIPGLNSSTKPVSNKVTMDKLNKKRDRSYDDELHRMNQFGFTRDVTLASSQSVKYNPPNGRQVPENAAFSHDPINRSMQNMAIAKPNVLASPAYQDVNASPGKLHSRGEPNRSMLTSSHKKYPNHHLYGQYNLINGNMHQTETNINKAVFKKAGGNILY